MLLAGVVSTSQRVAQTTRRLEKIQLLAALLQQLAADEVEPVVAFLSGRTRQGRIGIGYAALRDAAAPAAAEPALRIHDVDRALDSLGAVQGPGSEQEKRALLHALLARATAAEQQFLSALLIGEIRQGALEGIMLEALAKAAGVTPREVRRAVMMAGDIGRVARSLLESGAASLAQYAVQLFRPVKPMLAQSAEDISGALEDLGEAALEYKFDGARVQVHRSGDEVRIFSRRLNEVTGAVPEIVEMVRGLPARQLILDGEVLSLLPGGRPQPFQITMRRFGRKLDVERLRAELPLQPYWFDLLYLDGQSLVDEPQARRFQALAQIARPDTLAPHILTADAGRAAAFFREALERGHEGLMAKQPAAPYAAGARGQSWLKVKKAHTLDLVILAAEWGHGRRRGWLSNLHLGARHPAQGGYAMLGKTFKGLTDEMLAWQTRELLKLELARDRYTVYVEPKLVVEVAFGDLQVSPRYPEGLALRFARVKRYRPDKTPAEADTLETVRQMAAADRR
jgi:ATP-dependent DNA ligase I